MSAIKNTGLKHISVVSLVCKEKSTNTYYNYYMFLKGATEAVLNQCTKIQPDENEVNLDHERFGLCDIRF